MNRTSHNKYDEETFIKVKKEFKNNKRYGARIGQVNDAYSHYEVSQAALEQEKVAALA